MGQDIVLTLAAIVALGIGAQWLAWRFHVPAILLLLLTGFVAGPATGLLVPSETFGDLLFPVVSASVAIILFEGGLSLSLRELRVTGSVLWRLVTVGALATWAIAAAAANAFTPLSISMSVLLGAILIVTGPTVIGPLLRNVRPVGPVGPILRWEGILIDPIGAVIAVITLEVLLAGEERADLADVIARGAQTVGVGVLIGLGAAAAMTLLIKRYLIPDFLHNAFSLAVVLAAFTLSNRWVNESGLVTVTIMGIALANQRFASVRHIIEFKETLRVLLISGLFIVLAAELDVDALRQAGPLAIVFLVAIFMGRPIAVWVSTLGSKLSRRERVFLSVVAPRGIVAAAIASVFALELEEQHVAQAELLPPLAFLVIVGTIVFYGLAAPRLARRLGLSDLNPQGALFVGANQLARRVGEVLKDEGFRVVMVDTDWGNVAAARLKGLDAEFRSFLSEEVNHQTDLGGIGRLFAMTSNDELNALAIEHAVSLFGRANVYQLPPREDGSPRKRALAAHQRGRVLFDPEATYSVLGARFEQGTVKKTSLTEEFTFEDFKARYADGALPLFVVGSNGRLSVFSVDGRPTPKAGDKVISLIDPEALAAEAARAEAEKRDAERIAAARAEAAGSAAPETDPS